MVHCVAYGCNNKKKKGDGLHFFSFPKDPAMKKTWIVKLKREGYTWKPTHRLCSVHFTPDCYDNDPEFMAKLGYSNPLIKLKEDAVPTFVYKTPATQPRIQTKGGANAMDTAKATPKIRGGSLKRRRIQMLEDCYNEHSTEPQDNIVTEPENEMPFSSPVESKESSDIPSSPPLETEPIVLELVMNKGIQVKPPVNVKGILCQPNTTVTFTQTDVQMVDAATQYEEMPPVTPTTPLLCHVETQTETETVDDMDDSFESIAYDDDPEKDPDYVPHENLGQDLEEIQVEEQEIQNMPPEKEPKYLVFQSSLLQLFQTCSKVSCLCDIVTKKLTLVGTMVIVTVKCKVGHEWSWCSQPSHQGMPWGNLLTGAAILISGSGYSKIATFFRHLKIPCISQSTFTKTQRSYFVPVIVDFWANSRDFLLEGLQNQEVVVGGDGRCDSPGYCAKYGSYTLMDLERNKILDVQIVQSNEVGGSTHMELEGLKRGLTDLQEREINVVRVVTDRHVQVKKYMREDQPGIKHDFDVWHVANNVDKKLTAASKRKTGDQIKPWIASIKNHLYWVATSSGDDGPLKRAKWLSVLNHITDQHTGHSDLFPDCVHGELEPRQWIRKGSVPYKLLEPVINSNYLLKDIEKLSSAHQTYGLEVFHSVVLMFAPKSTHYFYWSMVARTYLAALHYNENSDNNQATTADGTLRYTPVFPKKNKGEVLVVKPVKEKATFNYAKQIIEAVVERRRNFPSYRLASNDADNLLIGHPASLTSNFVRQDKDQLIARRTTRFPQIQ